jgi:SpoVK/Ycf46/Vps4 family AAA+-type ATPase
VNREALERLATYLPPLQSAAPPILSPVAAEELRTLLLRCRHRASLADAAGGPLRGTLSRGVRALFSGPSGCGKSLAARHLAACMNLDVYRVDLAAVVNKYVGETERNLEQVLARAEELGVVLLLDEGDALMTKRTDVTTANDRYANLETNFLLQRLETFDGIAIITTNAGSRIDSAFLRRIDVTVEFVPPEADQRWQIWLTHLPAGNEVSPELVQRLAQRCTLTGGQIHNAVLHATLLSLDRDSPVCEDDVIAAVRREYRRSGASCPV